jgi:hypothetical protein
VEASTTVAGTADGTFKDVGGAELLPNLERGSRLVAEGEHLRAGENFQLGDFGKLGDNVFGNPIPKIFVFFSATLVFEVEDRD